MATKQTKADPASTKYDHRRDNLRNLIHAYDGPKALATKLGYKNASFLVQMAGPNPTRQVSERTAREIEKQLDMEHEYMDRKPGVPEAAAVDTDLVGSCIRIVAQECEDAGVKLVPAKFADLVTFVYSEAVANGGTIKLDQLKKIVRFAT